jgi:peptidoglycan/LPS O-acetylase OafA/YrhL
MWALYLILFQVMSYIPIQPQLHPKYRPDIDGLRAIAVLSVVIFHAFPKLIPGGFVGVDIFFVISGYLISTIIFENLDREIFSFRDFYSRRIRRIFPALLFVLFSCFSFGWFALLTEEYRLLGKHIVGGASFLSNFFLWNEAGYFDNIADTKPLLHLWSLGIEEQFYIIWPVLLWIAWKRRVNFLAILCFVALASFAINIVTIYTNSVAAFYSPLSRFWELLIGALLAYLLLYKKDLVARWSTSSDVISFIGLGLILAGVIILDKTSLFPGWWALLPTLGAALLIFSGPAGWVNRMILSNRLLVWVGLISFPLYLWHWPLLSFANIIQGEVVKYLRVALVVISVLLAWITYKLIEQPIRGGGKGDLKTIALISLMIIFGYVGYNTYQRGGLSFRTNAEFKTTYRGDIGHVDFHKYIVQNFYPCVPEKLAEQALKGGEFRCAQSKKDSDIQIALVGDSHAEHLFIGIAENLPEKNVAFYIKGSPPYLENKEFSNIFEFVSKSKSIKTVILTMHWPGRLGQSVPKDSTVEREILRTAHLFIDSGKDVYITDDVPVFRLPPDKCLGKRWLSTNETSCTIAKKDSDAQLRSYSHIIKNILNNDRRIKYIELNKYLCNESECSRINGADLLYRDQNHLNINGSKLIGKYIVINNPILNQ